jgi:spermidine/putrescine-binding protein
MKKYKYVMFILTLSFVSLLLSGCQSSRILLILNWGEYMNDDLIVEFEELYQVEVKVSIADSNELFYSKLKSGTTAYDLILPSDYMIEKMMNKGLLQEIQFDKLSNYNMSTNPYLQGLVKIRESMQEGSENYYVPYFWGTFGLMYNKRVLGLEEALETHQWDAYFEKSLQPSGTRSGMYDVPQFAYATSMIYLNEDPNIVTDTNISRAQTVLSGAGFEIWADDQLKKDIQNDNLDLAFVWTGDFLDVFYTDLADGKAYDEIPYNIFIPDTTLAFMDAFVIPKNSRHVDLAHEFINFFLDPRVAYDNASVIGYATPLQLTYDMITTYDGPITDEDYAWKRDSARAYLEYYEDTPDFTGIPLASLDQRTVTKLNLMVNNVKTG